MNKQSFDELLAAARDATLEENLECIELEFQFLRQDRDDMNAIAERIGTREQLIANLEDIIDQKRAAE